MFHDPLKWNQNEHDGCLGCIHESKDGDQEPCCRCLGTSTLDDPERKNKKDLFRATNDHDPVEHPSHYTQGNIDCIDAMESAFGAAELAIYCKIAAFKYLWRMEHKNGTQDVLKASWYINKMIELLKKIERN